MRELPPRKLQHRPLRLVEPLHKLQVVPREREHLQPQQQRRTTALLLAHALPHQQVAESVAAAAVVTRVGAAKRARGQRREAPPPRRRLPLCNRAIERVARQAGQQHLRGETGRLIILDWLEPPARQGGSTSYSTASGPRFSRPAAASAAGTVTPNQKTTHHASSASRESGTSPISRAVPYLTFGGARPSATW